MLQPDKRHTCTLTIKQVVVGKHDVLPSPGLDFKQLVVVRHPHTTWEQLWYRTTRHNHAAVVCCDLEVSFTWCCSLEGSACTVL